jgi:hypothetical protein
MTGSRGAAETRRNDRGREKVIKGRKLRLKRDRML